VKDFIRILMGIAFNLLTVFGDIAILTIFILLIHEYGRPFNLAVPSTISLFCPL
jgi:hypothetical protein